MGARADDVQPTAASAKSLRELPQDDADFDKAIRPCKILVRPLMVGLSRTFVAAGTSPLDKEEIEAGTVSFAALMYQYGANLDGRVMVALWLGGVALPRITEAIEKNRKEKSSALSMMKHPAGAPPSEVAPFPTKVG